MRQHKKIALDSGWSMGVIAHAQAQQLELCTRAQLAQHTALYEAIVPGCMELDLQRAGKLDDPYFGLNVLEVQKLEDLHVYYTSEFTFSREAGCTPLLVFEGLDTICDIYLNGRKLGHAENMFLEHTFDLNGAVQGKNELLLHFLPCCIWARDFPSAPGNYSHSLSNYEMLRLRKAPHMFGWDIAPRIVSAGIWRPAYVELVPVQHIDDLYYMTYAQNGDGNEAVLDLYFRLKLCAGLLDGYRLRICGQCGASVFSHEVALRFTTGVARICVPQALLWWPKGRGAQNLYTVHTELVFGDTVLDGWTQQVGIRTTRLKRTGITDANRSGEFRFFVNDEPLFLMGSNWVQLDSFHCNDAQRLEQAIALTDDIGCNALRCWGGNVYESEDFYRLCNEKGIVIWQDFSMACAVYPQDDMMNRVIEEEVKAVVKRLRRHACIVLWAGDNECDLVMSRTTGDRNPNCNRLTRKLIKELLEFEDPTRPYLPSSPFYDEDAYRVGRQFITENHLWGPRDYYKSSFYTQSLCHFVSEIGYHGCPTRTSAERFLSADALWPWQDNPEWIVHAANDNPHPNAIYARRVPLMANQIKELFGTVPDNFDDFALASQISQAEAKKFFIELFRQQRSYRTGIIWWNLLDCWPQFSDAVVDYYFVKKIAYDYIKRAQQPFMLLVGEPANWQQPVMAINDTKQPVSFTYTVKDAQSDAVLHSGSGAVLPDGDCVLAQLSYSQGDKRMYLLEWTTDHGVTGKNHYLAGNPPFDLSEYCALMHKHSL